MKKPLVIAISTCLIMIIIGICLIVAGVLNGAGREFGLDIKNRKLISYKDINYIEGEEETGKFSEFKIDVNYSNVKIVKGEEFKVKYGYYENNKITVSNENGCLSIREGKDSIDFISFNLFSDNEKKSYVEVYIPGEIRLEDSKISTDAGNIDIKSIALSHLDLDADAGNVNLDSVEATGIKINTDAGNVKICDIKTETFSADMNCGNLNISNSDIGNVKFDLDAGNLNMDETRVCDVTGKADYGNVKLGLIGETADYTFDLDTDYGNIKVNGDKKGTSYKNGEGKKTMKISVDAGDIDIDM